MVNPCSPGGPQARLPRDRHSWGKALSFSSLPLGLPPPSPPHPPALCPSAAGPGPLTQRMLPGLLALCPQCLSPWWGGGQGGGRRTTARLLQPWVLSRLHLDFLAPLEHSRSLSVPSHPPGVTAAGGLAGKGNASLTLRVGRLLVLPCQVERLGRARCYLSQAASQGLSDGGGLHQPHGAWPSEGYYLARMCVLLFPHLFFLLKWCSFAFAWMFHKDRGHLREV